MKTTTLTHERSCGSTRTEPLRAQMASDRATGRWRRGIGLTIAILASLVLWGLIALGAAALLR